MKIQTKAIIKCIAINGKPVLREGKRPIDLEFSAIDTGGGFKDPILDFSFSLDEVDVSGSEEYKKITFELLLQGPQNTDNEVTFSLGVDNMNSDKQINGRLKGDELSRELIGFVLQLLR